MKVFDEITRQNRKRILPGDIWILSKRQLSELIDIHLCSPIIGVSCIDLDHPIVMGHKTRIVKEYQLYMTDDEIRQDMAKQNMVEWFTNMGDLFPTARGKKK